MTVTAGDHVEPRCGMLWDDAQCALLEQTVKASAGFARARLQAVGLGAYTSDVLATATLRALTLDPPAATEPKAFTAWVRRIVANIVDETRRSAFLQGWAGFALEFDETTFEAARRYDRAWAALGDLEHAVRDRGRDWCALVEAGLTGPHAYEIRASIREFIERWQPWRAPEIPTRLLKFLVR